MLKTSSINVYDLRESIMSCLNPMRTELPNYTDDELFYRALSRAVKLANTPQGSGHSNFLKGIRVSFDLIYPNYISPELQRYNFIDIVSSSSKMHRLKALINLKSYNEYVLPETISFIEGLALKYRWDPSYENFMTLLSNCPQGIELFTRVSTNYLQLRTIYHQRKGHKLTEDWEEFCKMIEGLPYADELLTGKYKS